MSPGRLTELRRPEFSRLWISRVWISRGSRSAHWPPPRKDRAPPGSRTMMRSASNGWMPTGSATVNERAAPTARPCGGQGGEVEGQGRGAAAAAAEGGGEERATSAGPVCEESYA